MQKLAAEFIVLTQDACLKAFWTKKALRNFLRIHSISDEHLNKLNNEVTKNDFLADLFYFLSAPNNNYTDIILNIASSLSNMTQFPDLERWEDSKEKISVAKEAISRLKAEFDKIRFNANEHKRKKALRDELEKRRQEAVLARQSIDKIQNELLELSKKLGTQEAGYDFEKWFYNLAIFFDIDSRPPYKTDGRQIDGALTIDGTTFLVETKFTKNKIGVQDIDIFMNKVSTKADNTMGIFISMAGYSEEAIKGASRDKTPLILLDYSHIYNLILSRIMSLDDVIRRAKRHASQTGESYLPTVNFTG